MASNFDFSNKTALVTGGAQGIGFAITKNFLQAGANVVIWDYNQETLDVAQKELSQYSSQLKTFAVDVTNPEMCEKTASECKEIDILVNNAGITRDKSFKKMTHDDFKAVIDTNLTGLFNVTHALITKESFKSESKNNRIINMSSVVALYGNFGQTNYVAAKAGVIGLTKTWAKELGRKGFTSNAIAPGFIETKMTAAMPPEVLKSMTEKVPVERLGSVEDISQACMFLASESASYINGTVISVDGGMTL
jgi:3-oxoacyl-[acyl-carrier protein] reductase